MGAHRIEHGVGRVEEGVQCVGDDVVIEGGTDTLDNSRRQSTIDDRGSFANS